MNTHQLTHFPWTIVVEAPHAQRLDRYVVDCSSTTDHTLSRTKVQEFINAACIEVNGIVATKPSIMVRGGDVIVIKELHKTASQRHSSEIFNQLGVELIAEYEHFLVLNKPAGLVVHKPSSASEDVSVVDWLVHHYPEVAHVGAQGRPGIAHRLDKDTSGLLLVGRTPFGLETLQHMFSQRLIKKTYFALVQGHPQESGIIDYGIIRNSVIPTQMTHKIGTGKPAITHFHVMKYFQQHALLEAKPLTGRTHQIRVHCAAIGHPIVGDKVYGNESNLIKRQALHAAHLEFTFDNQPYEFAKNVPEDFVQALEALEGEAKEDRSW